MMSRAAGNQIQHIKDHLTGHNVGLPDVKIMAGSPEELVTAMAGFVVYHHILESSSVVNGKLETMEFILIKTGTKIMLKHNNI